MGVSVEWPLVKLTEIFSNVWLSSSSSAAYTRAKEIGYVLVRFEIYRRPLRVRGDWVLCNETGELSDRDRLRLCMWRGFGDEFGCSLSIFPPSY